MLVVSVAALYFAREILIPLAFALTLALLLNPIVAWLQRLHINRAAASLLALLLFVAAIMGIGWVIVGQLISVADQLPNYQQNIHNKVDAMRSSGRGALGRAAEGVASVAQELTTPQHSAIEDTERRNPQQPATGAPIPVVIAVGAKNNLQSALDVAKPFLAPLGTGFMVLIFTAFMLVKREDLRNRALRLAGVGQLNVMTEALDDGTRRVSTYLILQLSVNAVLGILICLGLWLIGVPYAALWGSIVALLRIVPYVGILVSAALPLTLSLAVFDGWEKPLFVIGLFLLLELVTGNVIEPLLYGAHTGISSLALLVCAVFWTILWGTPGLVLSTPLTVCVLVMGRYVPQLSFLPVLLGDEPVLEAEAHFYQRLLAMDIQEAKAVADAFLNGRTLLQFYDLLMIPALIMAEQDRHKGGLDSGREEFVFLGLGEIVVETSIPSDSPAQAFEPPTHRVICIPASDSADEIAATMLSRVLEQSGFVVIALPVFDSILDSLEMAQVAPEDILCISSVLPFAFTRAREVCLKIRSRFPTIKIVAGIWGFAGDAEQASRRFDRAVPNAVVGTLTQALSEIETLAGRRPLETEVPGTPALNAAEVVESR